MWRVSASGKSKGTNSLRGTEAFDVLRVGISSCSAGAKKELSGVAFLAKRTALYILAFGRRRSRISRASGFKLIPAKSGGRRANVVAGAKEAVALAQKSPLLTPHSTVTPSSQDRTTAGHNRLK